MKFRAQKPATLAVTNQAMDVNLGRVALCLPHLRGAITAGRVEDREYFPALNQKQTPEIEVAGELCDFCRA